MSKVIRTYAGTMRCDSQVTLTEYEYSDGTRGHWLFRDRLGRPSNPTTEEAEQIIKTWRLKEEERR